MPGNQPPAAPPPPDAQAQRPDDPRPATVDPRAAALAEDPTRLMLGPRRQEPGAASTTATGQAPQPPAETSAPDHVPTARLGTAHGTTPRPDQQQQQPAPQRPYYREGCRRLNPRDLQRCMDEQLAEVDD
eukprot:15473186-Alexandrium_andersonii.AAC.1